MIKKTFNLYTYAELTEPAQRQARKIFIEQEKLESERKQTLEIVEVLCTVSGAYIKYREHFFNSETEFNPTVEYISQIDSLEGEQGVDKIRKQVMTKLDEKNNTLRHIVEITMKNANRQQPINKWFNNVVRNTFYLISKHASDRLSQVGVHDYLTEYGRLYFEDGIECLWEGEEDE